MAPADYAGQLENCRQCGTPLIAKEVEFQGKKRFSWRNADGSAHKKKVGERWECQIPGATAPAQPAAQQPAQAPAQAPPQPQAPAPAKQVHVTKCLNQDWLAMVFDAYDDVRETAKARLCKDGKPPADVEVGLATKLVWDAVLSNKPWA